MKLQMMVSINGQERTYDHLKKIAAAAGWKASKIYGEHRSHKLVEFVKMEV